MSDLHDETKQMPVDTPQDTRKVPAVSKEPQSENLLRSRVQRNEPAPVNTQKAVAAAPETASEVENSRVQTRIVPADAPGNASKSIPTPKALDRAQRGIPGMENRRTTNASVPARKNPLEHSRRREHPARVDKPKLLIQPTVSKPTLEFQNNEESFEQITEEERPHNNSLVVIIAVVLILALLVVGLLMIPSDAPGFPGNMKRAVISVFGAADPTQPPIIAASDFSGMPLEGVAPLEVTFTLTTGKQAQQVRIVDENGAPMNAEARLMTDNADNRVWSLTMTVNQAYSGMVQAQVSAGETWQDTGCTQQLLVSGTLSATTDAPTQEPIVTNAPTQEPIVTDAPTQEPIVTDAPTQEPIVTDAPTQEPIVTDAPTQEPIVTDAPTQEPVVTDAPTQEPATDEPTQAPVATPTPSPATTEPPALEPVVTLLLDNSPTPTVSPIFSGEVEPLSSVEPTEAPDVQPTAEPKVQPTEEPQPQQTEAEVPAQLTATPSLTAQAVEEALPEKLIAESTIYNNAGRELEEYTRDLSEQINMPAVGAYSPKPIGVLTFRGDSFRQNAAHGVATNSDLSSMSILWQADMGRIKAADGDYYYGAGYQSQPAIIKWSTLVRDLSNISDEKKAVKGLKEVIMPGMDGNIYFLDLADGQPTRKAIKLGYPMRSAPSIHPLSFPVMAVGQYARKMASGTGKIGLRFYDLLTQRQLYLLDGLDSDSKRPYYTVGSFETSSLMDAVSDTMISLGTNGMVYLTRMHTEFSKNDGTISITPESITMTSRIEKQKNKNTAVESSMAAYQHYMWYADMEGILRCVDTDTLQIVWAVDTGDSVEAAISLRQDESGDLWLYTANELNLRGKGDVSISCYNALTGACRWTQSVPVVKGKPYVSGVKASPVIGQNDLDGLVYFSVSGAQRDGKTVNGMVIAMDAETGDIIWKHDTSGYVYSSPVAVYSESGMGWIIQADSTGELQLINGLTGGTVSTLKIEGSFESSPAVYNNILVIATSGRNKPAIYGIALE